MTCSACTLVGFGTGAIVDEAAGTGHTGKAIGLKLGLSIDIAFVIWLFEAATGHW